MAQSVLGKINYLTDAQYRKAKEEGNIDPNQIYLTPDDSDTKDYINLEVGVVETLPSGSDATAEITGTVTNPILNLGIPTGPQGPEGPTGPTGPSPSITDVLKAVYPVGSVYLSINNTNPSSIFGFGTWVKESGGYLYGCVSSVSNSTYTGLNTQSGGSGTSGSTTLSADQSGLPSHTHTGTTSENGSHTHSYNGWWTFQQGHYDGAIARTRQSDGAQTDPFNAAGNHKHTFTTAATGGTAAKSGHTHSVPGHTHNVAHIGVFIWRRTA